MTDEREGVASVLHHGIAFMATARLLEELHELEETAGVG
jgi:hypothetical protein